MLANSKKHIIILGRVSEDIRENVINTFGKENVIDAAVSKFKDQEAYCAAYRDMNAKGELDGLTDDKVTETVEAEASRRQLMDLHLNGAEVTFINSASGDNVSARSMSLLFALMHLKEEKKVSRIHVIEPYTPFMRNDRPFHKSIIRNGSKIAEYGQDNAVSCQYYAELLKFAGADSHIGFTNHSQDAAKHFTAAFGFSLPAPFNWIFNNIPNRPLRGIFNQAAEYFGLAPKSEFISTAKFFSEQFLKDKSLNEDIENGNIIIGAPDGANKPNDEGIKRAIALRNAILKGNAPKDPMNDPNMFFITKRRIDENKTEIENFKVGGNGSVKNKTAIITDDVISSGSTLFEAAKALKDNGAKKVIAAITHGVLVNSAIDKVLDNDALDEVWITDSIPSTVEKIQDAFDNIRKAEALGKITEEKATKIARLSKIKIKGMNSLIIENIQRLHHNRNLTFANNNNNTLPHQELAPS